MSFKTYTIELRRVRGRSGFSLQRSGASVEAQDTNSGLLAILTAAIYFKNRISKAWDPSRISPSVSPIDPAERVVIKEQLLNVMTKVPQAVK